ncbi:MAG: hypothetical protein ACREOM_01125 [Candidatus Dormibacteraceae bacterium]
MIFAVVVVFAILLVVSRSAGYLRGRMHVADAEDGGSTEVHRSAAVGAGAGVAVLALLALLFAGITQWDWLGRPASHSAPAVFSPVPLQSPPSGAGITTSPSPPPVLASPSPQH